MLSGYSSFVAVEVCESPAEGAVAGESVPAPVGVADSPEPSFCGKLITLSPLSLLLPVLAAGVPKLIELPGGANLANLSNMVKPRNETRSAGTTIKPAAATAGHLIMSAVLQE